MLVISAYLIKKLLPGGVRLDRELELSVNRRHTDVYRLHHSQARLRHYCKYCLKIINNFKDFIKKRSQHEPVLTVVFPFFKIKNVVKFNKSSFEKTNQNPGFGSAKMCGFADPDYKGNKEWILSSAWVYSSKMVKCVWNAFSKMNREGGKVHLVKFLVLRSTTVFN